MPPTSRKQQKLVYARAEQGVAWARRWVREGNMKVKKKKKKRKKKR